MRTYLTADLHFNCPGLVRQTRPWTTPEEHDDYVIDCINSQVEVRDRLIIIGDFCKGKPFKYRQKIRCRNIWYVLGNHDKPRRAYEDCFGKDRVREIFDTKLTFVDEVRKVTCCHYPMLHFNCSHYGAYHCYGHVHGAKEDEIDKAFPDRRSIDVGVDNAYHFFGAPVPFPDFFLLMYLDARPGHGLIKPEDRWKERDF